MATEMALVLPFVVFAILVIVDFCRLYHVTQTLSASAHVGAYHASGAGQPPAYRPPTGGLLPLVTEVVAPLLGGQAAGTTTSTGPDLEGKWIEEQAYDPETLERVNSTPHLFYWLRWQGSQQSTLPNYEAWPKGIWFPIPARKEMKAGEGS